jgi:hypothetical protein
MGETFIKSERIASGMLEILTGEEELKYLDCGWQRLQPYGAAL